MAQRFSEDCEVAENECSCRSVTSRTEGGRKGKICAELQHVDFAPRQYVSTHSALCKTALDEQMHNCASASTVLIRSPTL
ncbi:hypothetical protein TNCV_2093081 [Trichonephila clavipes]|nr:hypothetical protein TNCV_2093081 [Trichonephila clavipes]